MDVGGEVVKDNETYILKDNTSLKNLVLSSTDLKPPKAQMDIRIQDKKKSITLLMEQE
tara:strand:- start:83 stop:256 length:174 start_codon:yes stop_codon:yes gene_type:complete